MYRPYHPGVNTSVYCILNILKEGIYSLVLLRLDGYPVFYSPRSFQKQQKKKMPCESCGGFSPRYGLPHSPRMWCRPCAEFQWEMRHTPEEERVDSLPKCLRCQVMRPSFGLPQASRMWCRKCAGQEWEERHTPTEDRVRAPF